MSQHPNHPQPTAARPADRPAAPQRANKSARSNPTMPEQAEEAPVERDGNGSNFVLFNAMPSVLTSMIVHAVGLVVLALIVVAVAPPEFVSEFTMPPKDKEEIETIDDEPVVVPPELNVKTSDLQPTDLTPVNEEAETPEVDSLSADDLNQEAVLVPEFDPLGAIAVSPEAIIFTIDYNPGDLDDRLTPERRRERALT